jgi:single-strand DNA-binding protein
VAEIGARFLHKGTKVYLEGRRSQRKYTDREGVGRTSVEVIASEMGMLSPRLVLRAVGAREDHDPFLPDLPLDASRSRLRQLDTPREPVRGSPKRGFIGSRETRTL